MTTDTAQATTPVYVYTRTTRNINPDMFCETAAVPTAVLKQVISSIRIYGRGCGRWERRRLVCMARSTLASSWRPV